MGSREWLGLSMSCRADLQTFARLHDLASIPITHALFAEHSDVTDVILKTPNVGFSELLSNPKANAVLKYFLVCPHRSYVIRSC
jgi:hypothetical protein